MEDELPEVTLLYDARGERPEGALGVGDLWYEPEVWSLPLCSFLGHGEINCKDLRNTLRSCSDAAIRGAFEELVRRNLLAPEPTHGDGLASYAVRSVKMFEG